MNCTKRYIWWGLDWKQNNTCSQYIRWRNIWLSYNLESQETWTSNTRYYHHFFWCEAGRTNTNRTPKLIYEIIKVLKTGTTGVCDVKCMHGSILFILSKYYEPACQSCYTNAIYYNPNLFYNNLILSGFTTAYMWQDIILVNSRPCYLQIGKYSRSQWNSFVITIDIYSIITWFCLKNNS